MSACTGTSGDIAFMLAATTFVFLQTPAMGLAQAGLIKRKNALTMITQTLTGAVIGSVLWMCFGYSLTFGPSLGGFIGDLSKAFLFNVSINECDPTAPAIPEIMFVSFQMMFALMTPVIVTGAWAERMHFEAFILFTLLWPIFVYYPLAHWIWNLNGWLNVLGVKDFAGGCVIHFSTGVSALVVCKFLAPRERSKSSRKLASHNLLLSMLGSSLIWGGWYSFNGGSAYAANSQAANALINTHLAACGGSAVWLIVSYYRERKYHLMDVMSGALAGLGSITAGSGFVAPSSAFLIGSLGALLSNLWVYRMKPWLKLDDTLDVAGLQGVPGLLGSIAVAFFSKDTAINGTKGIFYGGSFHFLVVQIYAALATLAIALVGTTLVMFVIQYILNKYSKGLNVTAEEEQIGLDLIQIGEQAYDFKLPTVVDIGEEALLLKLNEACGAGNLKEVKKLIKEGADPDGKDYDGRTPGHLAAAEGHLAVLTFLVEHCRIDINAEDRFGNTVLGDAMHHHHRECCAFLQKRGDAKVIAGKGYVENIDIFHASAVGNLDEVQYFVELARQSVTSGNATEGIKKVVEVINESDYDKRTPLHLAASEGRTEVVRYLIKHGANMNLLDRWGSTPLDDAYKNKHKGVINVFNEIMNNNNNDGKYVVDTPTKITSPSQPTSKKSQVLLNDPAFLNQFNYNNINNKNGNVRNASILKHVKIVTGEGDTSMTPLLSKDNNLDSTFPDIAEMSPDSAIKSNPHISKLGKQGSSFQVLDTSSTMLLQAAEEGQFDEVVALINKGTDLEAGDYDSRTALHISAAKGHVNIVRLLLEKDVNPNVFDRFNNTPLQDALLWNHLECALLIKKAGGTITNPKIAKKLCSNAAIGNLFEIEKMEASGCDLNVVDYDGRSCLHLACSEGHANVVEWLLSKGVFREPRDRYGFTPYEDAVRGGHTLCIELLKRCGVKEHHHRNKSSVIDDSSI